MLVNGNLTTIEVLISKVLIDSYIADNEFVYMNNVSREYDGMREAIKNPKASVVYQKF